MKHWWNSYNFFFHLEKFLFAVEDWIHVCVDDIPLMQKLATDDEISSHLGHLFYIKLLKTSYNLPSWWVYLCVSETWNLWKRLRLKRCKLGSQTWIKIFDSIYNHSLENAIFKGFSFTNNFFHSIPCFFFIFCL